GRPGRRARHQPPAGARHRPDALGLARGLPADGRGRRPVRRPVRGPAHSRSRPKSGESMSAAPGTAPDPDDRPALSTSRSLLAHAGANDPAAWDRLIALYAPLVWSWCRKMRLQHQDAADVFQEVFKAVATHLAQFHKSKPGDTFRGWLRTITRNK